MLLNWKGGTHSPTSQRTQHFESMVREPCVRMEALSQSEPKQNKTKQTSDNYQKMLLYSNQTIAGCMPRTPYFILNSWISYWYPLQCQIYSDTNQFRESRSDDNGFLVSVSGHDVTFVSGRLSHFTDRAINLALVTYAIWICLIIMTLGIVTRFLD